MAQKAALVVTGDHTRDSHEEIAWRIAEQYGDETVEVVAWETSDELPDWISVGLADQLTAHKRDAGPEAKYMLVFMGTEEELGAEDE